MPCGEILNFKVAALSEIPLPEKERISGKRACNAGSKLDASNTSNCSNVPAALGSVMVDECLLAFPTIANKSLLIASISKLNNLKSLGNDCLATALSVLIVAVPVCKVQLSFCCADMILINISDKNPSNNFFINRLFWFLLN